MLCFSPVQKHLERNGLSMNEFVIVTDTSTDLPASYFEQHHIPLLTLYYTIDGVTGPNGCPSKEQIQAFYQKMRDGSQPKTQQVNPGDAEKTFREVLEQGKDILYVGFSSGLSGTVNSARVAADALEGVFPERKIVVVDTLCASLGEGLILDYAVRMKDEGKTLGEIAHWLEENKLHICHNVAVEDLVYLQRGGRISKATAFFGSMIGIKPIIHVDNEGKLVPIGKARGRKPSLIALVDNMEKQLGHYRNTKQRIFISHGDCQEDAEFVADLVKERFGYDEFLINGIGPTIGSHAGPGTIALFFMGETR